jgi:hypothetical protein
MKENSSVKLAYHRATDKILHIDNAKNGRSCDCECIACKENLIAVQGEVREKHFRHDINQNCLGAQETALHQLGKQIVIEQNQIEIPGHGMINYSEAIAEKKLYSTRPDVTAIYNHQEIYFEIAVKHFIEKDKALFFITGNHKCVEIDLSSAETDTYKKIEHLVIYESKNKKLYGWKEFIPEQSNDNWIVKIVFALILGFIGRWIWKRFRKK